MMGMGPVSLRFAFVLASGLSASACMSGQGGGAAGPASMAGPLLDRLVSSDDGKKEGGAAPSPRVSLKTASEVNYASIGLILEDSPEVLLVMANKSGTDELYTLGYRISLVLREGRVVRTGGFAHDLMGMRWRGPDIVREAVTHSGPVSGVRSFEIEDRGIERFEAQCSAVYAGDETIDILGSAVALRHIVENCSVPGMKWRFANEFWVAPDGGQIWASVQYVHPKVSPLRITVFRPAG